MAASSQERGRMARVLDGVAAVIDGLHLTGAVKAVVPTRLRQWVVKRRDRSLVPEDELRRWYGQALKILLERRAGRVLGDYLEFGVYRGDSLRCMYEALEAHGLHGVRLIGFDSFEGLPPLGQGDTGLPWLEGDYAYSERETRARLTQAGIDMSRVHLVKGWYSDTLTGELARELRIAKVSVIMIDCDLYSSTKEALDFCAPLIEDDVVVFFDDWDGGRGLAERGLGERRAFDEFLAERS